MDCEVTWYITCSLALFFYEYFLFEATTVSAVSGGICDEK